jgi:hypothetical protein
MKKLKDTSLARWKTMRRLTLKNEMKNNPVLKEQVELDKTLVEQIKYHAFVEKQILQGEKQILQGKRS